MQWLTAVLAFATTMLIFAVIVTTLVETIHRTLGSRAIGLESMLQHFYDRVLKPHLDSAAPQLTRDDFVKIMAVVRAPSSKPKQESKAAVTPHRWSFKRLTHLPTGTFMERLGSSSFSTVVKSETEQGKKLLKDIAQKYETFGEESSLHFETKARLVSVVVAIFVAWIFYVHPYDLIQTYLKDPETAARVAALADAQNDDYAELVKEAEKLQAELSKGGSATPPATKERLDELLEELSNDLETARNKVTEVSEAGAPIGWPEDEKKFTCRGEWVTVCSPKQGKDIFWLLMGGLLIGLGAPFWARLISQLTRAQGAANNVANILKPQTRVQSPQPATQIVAAADESPVTSEAFLAAAGARAVAPSPPSPPGTSGKQ